MTTEEHILKAQEQWGEGIVALGKFSGDQKELAAQAENFLRDRYCFNEGPVLFKPTAATEQPCRSDLASAASYFVACGNSIAEDKGFALEPWTEVIFNNAQFYFQSAIAVVMGQYTFVGAARTLIADYSFGYVRDSSDDLKIVLHHSSFNSQS